ncbi:cytochrome P450 [Streptomyces sp. CA-249302]|uniref:cytochrome P450 n=1 Tax=Streptomyces sp. CA-249302 TaxID=3240058 RepID=UPI003D91F93D
MSTLSSDSPQAAGAPVADWFEVSHLFGDPLEISRRMRQEGHDIVFVPLLNLHFTCSNAVGRAIWSDTGNWCNLRGEIPLVKAIGPNLMFKQDPEHADERAVVNPSLRPKTVTDTWRPVFRRHAEQLVDELMEQGPGADVNKHFAVPYAALNLAAISGLTQVPWQDIARWSHAFIAAAQNQLDDPALWPPAEEARAEVDAAIDVAIERLKREPDDSMLSAMVNRPEPLPIDVIRGTMRLAVTGGVNEPQHSLLHGLWAFEQHPDQKARLLENPLCFSQAFDEVVRWLPPITTVAREALNSVTVGGIAFRPGDIVVLQISGANRDPEQFDDPDSFNVFRERRPHFAFGGGDHLCAGIWASRVAAQVAWTVLFDRLEGFRVVDPDATEWFGFTYRGIENLPVTWDAVRSA